MKISHLRDPVQQDSMFLNLLGQLPFIDFSTTQRSPENCDPLLVTGQSWVSSPHIVRCAISLVKQMFAIRRPFSTPVPHLSLALIHLDHNWISTDCSTVATRSGRVVTFTSRMAAVNFELLAGLGAHPKRTRPVSKDHLPRLRPVESHEPPLPRLPTDVRKGFRRTAGRKGGSVSPSGIRWPALIIARLEIKSNAPTPSKDNTVALGSLSVVTCTACAMLSDPALVAKAYWNGFVAVSNLAMNSLALVLATRRLMTSPSTIPRTPPFSFCSAVICPPRSAARMSSRMLAYGTCCNPQRYPGEDADVLSSTRQAVPSSNSEEIRLCPTRMVWLGLPQNFLRNRIAWHGSWMTLAKPTLANRGLDRLWPNRLWPILVFECVDRLWPNRLWPILVFWCFDQIFRTQKAQTPNPKTCIRTWTPNPPDPNPKLRDTEPDPLEPLRPHIPWGHIYSGLASTPLLAVLVLLWLSLLWLLLVWTPWTTLRQTTGRRTPLPDPLRTAQNFVLFFPLPAPFRSFSLSLGISSCLFFSLRVSSRVFFPLSGGLFVEFWWCFGRSGTPNVLVFTLGLSCKTPAACRPPGASTRQPKNSKRAHLIALALQKHH